MSVAERRRQGTGPVESSLSNLSLTSSKPSSKKNPTIVADSWEDEVDASASDSDSSGPSTPTAPSIASPHPAAPPPTPSSPNAAFHGNYGLPADFPSMASAIRMEAGAGERGKGKADGARPDKTTAAASRMIAGALGVRAPRKDEDMKRFEKAATEKEKARRDRERHEREEEERRKRSVWEE